MSSDDYFLGLITLCIVAAALRLLALIFVELV